MTEGKIAEASGSAAASRVPGLGARIEAAMVEAAEAAHSKGIVDPDKILALKLAARAAGGTRHGCLVTASV